MIKVVALLHDLYDGPIRVVDFAEISFHMLKKESIKYHIQDRGNIAAQRTWPDEYGQYLKNEDEDPIPEKMKTNRLNTRRMTTNMPNTCRMKTNMSNT